jgi:hypothetical protein
MSSRIAFIDALNAKGRCEISPVRLVADEPGYGPLVALPSDEWEPLSEAEVAALRPEADTPDSATFEVVRVPFADGELDEVRARSVEFSLEDGSQTTPFDPFRGQYPSIFLGHTESPAGQRTTTVDQRVDRRTGLHIDNWDKLSLAERSRSRRRIAINLGPGDRYVIVATQDICDLNAVHPIDAPFPRTGHIHEYLQHGGTLRCVRIRFEPGEGYVAPTELVPHDGSTLGIEQPSRIAFWLGDWPTGFFPPAVA